MPDPTCKTCGARFPRKGRSGNLAFYCSRNCNPRYGPSIRSCKFCGTEFDRKGTNRVHCSMACRDRWRRHGKTLEELQRDCATCGAVIDFEELGHAGRRRRIDANYCLGCRRNANYPLSVADLAERDGAACSLCGESVDLTIRWPDPGSPTVDHVIPWATSRSNDPANLALAHFTCNLAKRFTDDGVTTA